MKQVTMLLACTVLTTASIAQTSSGTITFGANVISSSINSFDTKPVYQQNLQSRVGYFVANNVAVGLNMENSLNQNKTLPFSLNMFGRYYAGRKTNQVVKLFVEGGAGMGHRIIVTKDDEMMPTRNKRFTATAYVSPGVNVFLCKAIALEVVGEYRYAGGLEPANRLGAGAGLKFFLNEQVFKSIFPHTFNGMH